MRYGRRPNKYGARKTVVDGITFDSAKEAKRWGELRLLERAGEVARLERQVAYRLEVNGVLVGSYRADFRYEEGGGRVVVEDVKGVRTPLYRVKKRLMLALFGIEIRET